MSNDPMLEMFIFENMQLTERLEEVLIEGEQLGALNSEHINEIFRIMHTIKGSSAMMEYTNISALAHSVEDMFFYIREHEAVQPDWSAIADLCLESADFFKAEIGKIQRGVPSDGDHTDLLSRINDYMQILKGESALPAEQKAADPALSAWPVDATAADGELVYRVLVWFDEGCKMENIRAYQILNALTDFASRVDTNPADLLEDCSDQIIASGVLFTLHTSQPKDIVEEVFARALFVKAYEFQMVNTNGDEPAASAAEPEEKTQAAPPPEPDRAPPEKTEEPKKEAAPPAAPSTPAAPATEAKQSFISVNVDKLDKLMDLVGELVISVSMVVSNPDLHGLQLDNFEKAAGLLSKNTGELQDVIMSVRMIPVSSTFHKMHRIVRDVSRKLGKDVELTILGEETEVDKNIIDNLSDPLMHIIRNSMDHGLEDSREARRAAGKPPAGKIILEARNSGSDVIISCTDDGRGLNREKILDKAKRQGMLTKPEQEYSDKEIYNFIMLPGFSTNESVTELSGRGVGMDVVKKNIEKIGGSVLLDSSPGQGTTVTIRIPLTLAILAGIEIKVGESHYLVPTLNIRESFKPATQDIIIDPDGNEMILFRGECYPIVRLATLFGVESYISRFEEGIMIMVEDEGQMAGLFADDLVGEQQVVVKPIPSFITKRIGQIHGISGCTIMGNGSISLIVDVKSLT